MIDFPPGPSSLSSVIPHDGYRRAGPRDRGRPRPVGRCERCGKPIWTYRERRNTQGEIHHAGCNPPGVYRPPPV